MLSIGKLGAGRPPVAYYISRVAQGIEDYYMGAGEAPGEWVGGGAELLGLAGRVDAADLRAVMEGRNPQTGESLLAGNSGHRSVPGFDLTFSAPKSISLLYAFGDERVRGQVIAAHDAAVRATLTHFLEPHVILTRRGAGGREVIATTGAVAATFRHRTSRAGDPTLHTHLLVANLVQGVDGRWATLHGAALYPNAKAGAYVYRAHLRYELTQRLGVEWGPLQHGIAEIKGVHRPIIRHFSRRAEEIRAAMEARGTTGMRASHVAALATRKAKDYGVSAETLQERWDARGAQLRFGREQVAALVGREPPTLRSHRDPGPVFDHLVSPEGLTKEASTFSWRDVVMALADHAPRGLRADVLGQLADEFVASPRVVPVAEPIAWRTHDAAIRVGRSAADRTAARHDPEAELRRQRVVAVLRDEVRYSTPEMLATEAHIIEAGLARQRAGVGVAEPATLEAALARRPTMTDEQRAMVAALTSSGAGVEVVSAGPGAGKTFSLDAAREAWEASGFRVVGAAVAARHAEELRAGAGIDSYTVDRLLLDLRHERGSLPPNAVLVVDEAGLIGTRKAAELLAVAERAEAKAVLVGDPYQLQPIDAGGLLRGLSRRLGSHELRENMRQREAWEREAVAELRDGDVVKGLSAYVEHDRVIASDTAAGARARLAADWWERVQAGEQAVMFAPRNDDADRLNRLARAHLREAAEIFGPELWVDGRPFQVGDWVMTTKNNYRLGVLNGTVGAVVGIDLEARKLTLARADGRQVSLDASYLDRGHLRHAYALTTFKVEGMTVDAALFLGDASVYREQLATSFSRGRQENRFYITVGDFLPEALDVPPDRREAVAEVMRAAQRSRAKELAIDHGGEQGTAGVPLAQLYREREALERVVPRDRTDDIAQRRATLREDLRRVEFLLAEGQRLQAAPDPQRRRALEGRTVAMRAQEVAKVRARLDALERSARQPRLTPEQQAGARRLEALNAAIAAREARQVAHVTATEPAYLVNALGRRPASPAAREAWREGTAAVERYRLRWGVTDPERAVGRQPRSTRALADYFAASAAVRETPPALERLARTPTRTVPHRAEPGGLERAIVLRPKRPA